MDFLRVAQPFLPGILVSLETVPLSRRSKARRSARGARPEEVKKKEGRGRGEKKKRELIPLVQRTNGKDGRGDGEWSMNVHL